MGRVVELFLYTAMKRLCIRSALVRVLWPFSLYTTDIRCFTGQWNVPIPNNALRQRNRSSEVSVSRCRPQYSDLGFGGDWRKRHRVTQTSRNIQIIYLLPIHPCPRTEASDIDLTKNYETIFSRHFMNSETKNCGLISPPSLWSGSFRSIVYRSCSIWPLAVTENTGFRLVGTSAIQTSQGSKFKGISRFASKQMLGAGNVPSSETSNITLSV